MKPFFTALALMTIPTAIFAGIPIKNEATCPVGGEKFTYAGTASCSSGQYNRTMSFFTPSSCDFIERLPTCPTNKLPVYREFTKDEVDRLDDFIETVDYTDNLDKSKWLRAVLIEKELNPTYQPLDLYWLMMRGYWYDSDNAFPSSEYFETYKEIADQSFDLASEQERPYFYAIDSYISLQNGDTDRARASLNTAKPLASENEQLEMYISRIENCFDDPQQDQCKPMAPINIDAP